MSIADEVLATHWDMVVLGTGVGGATLGYALAQKGKRVLFCEKGRSSSSNSQAFRGAYAEESFPLSEAPGAKHAQMLANAGRCAEEWTDASARKGRFVPFIGNGTGGSSALYGMAMERLFPSDFSQGGRHLTVPDTASPRSWPIAYEQMSRHYEAAERLYRVRGEADPLRQGERRGYIAEPAVLSPASRELSELFQRKGLHPYRLPVACELVEGCTGCQGYLCARECKNDSARICLKPAVNSHGAALMDECEVLSLEAETSRVTGAICDWHGRRVTLRAKMFALAAGALESPRILLRSASALWPQGLANNSGLVGKNLMRHFIDLWLVFTKSPIDAGDYSKQIAFNDLYETHGQKLGSVQSFGRMPSPRVVVAEMVEDARNGGFPPLAVLLKGLGPLLEPLLRAAFSRGVMLASIVEDFPYLDNQVTLQDAVKPGARAFRYRVRESEQRRIALMRERMKLLLRPYRYVRIKQAENNHRLAHACGTCRFGVDPRSSVLDPNNRAHGLSNLFVVDGSFFPSSGGTNPALTIAANALRVADYVLEG